MKYIIETDIPIEEYIEPKVPDFPIGSILPNYNFTWEEVLGVGGDAINYITYEEFSKYRDNALLLGIMLQEFRDWYGKPIHIESWLRSEYYNNVVLPDKGYNSSRISDHLEARAADTSVPVTSGNINKWKEICSKHKVYWSYGLYNNWMHLGFRFDKNNSWDYR